jgi:exonuclease VII large subunit
MDNKIIDLFSKCEKILQEIIINKTRAFYNLSAKLQTPKMLIEKEELKLKSTSDKLKKIIDSFFENTNYKLQNYNNMLEALSHLGTLKRGYSLVKSLKTNQLISSSVSLEKEEQIEIIMHDGKRQARIEN